MSINFDDPSFYPLETNPVVATLQEAASNVAQSYGSDYDTVFPNNIEFPERVGAQIMIKSTNETSTVTWYYGKSPTFASTFITRLNNELKELNNVIRFEEGINEYEYEDPNVFDLKVASFFLLMQTVAQGITTDKFSNMYFYLNRMGMRTNAYWSFQYIWWMILGSIAILIIFIFSKIIRRDFDNTVGYFLSMWFHVSLGVLLGVIFRNKKYVNIATTVLLIVGFVAPIVFVFALSQSQSIEERLSIIRKVPIYFTSIEPDQEAKTISIIVSAALMILSAYLAPLLCVSEGMYVGSKRNFFYFLSPKYWTEGIVALPSHEEVTVDDNFHDGNAIIQFRGCTKTFKEKVIGPMNVSLSKGKITTLLGGNGVGKSTMIKISSGYFIPNGGEIIMEGKNIFRQDTWKHLRSISFCPQDNTLYDNLTVYEHMQLVASIRDMSAVDDIEQHIDFILTTLDIVSKRTTLAINLSGGMKRRLCLAMAVMGWPKVILADEPSSGVDSGNQRGIWKLLEIAKEHSAILVTSHSAIEAAILSESIITMMTSTDIVQTTGKEGVIFSNKNRIDNATTEYSISQSDFSSISAVIQSLPNDGSEWKVSSKSLTTLSSLPGFDQVLKEREDVDNDSPDNSGSDTLRPSSEIPETLSCDAPSTIKQVYILLTVSFFHPERIGFLMTMGIPLNVGFIVFTHFFGGFNDETLNILTPMIPLIFFIVTSILVSNSTQILAAEKDLKVAKLLFSQGINRLAYLTSYLVYYFTLSFPVSAVALCIIGSIYGNAVSTFSLFTLFFSCWFLNMGICLMLGAVLDARTAMITTILLPSCFALFGQGALNNNFANKYPGSNGQVMARLLINNMDNQNWTWFAVSILINVVIGIIGVTIFLLKFENYNPSKLCSKKKNEDSMEYDIEETENVSEDVLLEGRDLVKVYGTGVKDSSSFRALDDVSFAVTKGSLLGLVGRSGAGKTTLMEVLSGQINVTSGSLYVEGKKVNPANIASVVSICSQLDTIWPDMTVINAIKIFMKCRGYENNSFSRTEILDPYVAYIVRELGMEEMLSKKVKTLSGGQKRRLAFLSSLVGATKVVLIDEAMTGVDIESRQIMWKILQDEVKLRARSVVVTTHDIGEVEQFCNFVGIIHSGQLIEMGLLSEIKKKWNNSMKLLLLLKSDQSEMIRDKLISQNSHISINNSPLLNHLNTDGKTLVTFSIDLGDINNISNLIMKLVDLKDDSILYWCLEQFSLDDFVRSTGTTTTNDVQMS